MSEPLRLKTILVPMDFSTHADRALQEARALSEDAGSAGPSTCARPRAAIQRGGRSRL